MLRRAPPSTHKDSPYFDTDTFAAIQGTPPKVSFLDRRRARQLKSRSIRVVWRTQWHLQTQIRVHARQLAVLRSSSDRTETLAPERQNMSKSRPRTSDPRNRHSV